MPQRAQPAMHGRECLGILGWVGWAGLGWTELGWVGLGRVGLGWVDFSWVGLGWAGLGLTGLGWAGLGWSRADWVGSGRWLSACHLGCVDQSSRVRFAMCKIHVGLHSEPARAHA